MQSSQETLLRGHLSARAAAARSPARSAAAPRARRCQRARRPRPRAAAPPPPRPGAGAHTHVWPAARQTSPSACTMHRERGWQLRCIRASTVLPCNAVPSQRQDTAHLRGYHKAESLAGLLRRDPCVAVPETLASPARLRGGLLELRSARAQAVALRHQHAQHRALAAGRGACRRPASRTLAGPCRRTRAQRSGMARCTRALRNLHMQRECSEPRLSPRGSACPRRRRRARRTGRTRRRRMRRPAARPRPPRRQRSARPAGRPPGALPAPARRPRAPLRPPRAPPRPPPRLRERGKLVLI